ncbi:MAG: nuclear transport factor 2 family protein [Deltaproteobacteria bacterium]|nr:nuclear transport factor 2 family protein [Deltaproteobacteria bacterium]
MTRDEALALFGRRRDAWLSGDLETYLALFAADLVFQSPAHAEPLIGRDAFEKLVRASAAHLEPQEFVFTDLAVDGDVVLAEWRIAARHRATGRRIEWWGMSTCSTRDGLITRWREYWNPADVR